MQGVLPRPEAQVLLRSATAECIDWLACQLEAAPHGFAFDYETFLLPWWHRDFRATAISFSWDGDTAYVVPFRNPEFSLPTGLREYFYERLRPVMESPDVPKIAWNAMFDALVWFREGGYIPFIHHDAMIQGHLLNENIPHGLKWNGRAYLLWDDWDIQTAQKTGEGISLADLAFYCGCDSAATWRLCQRFLRDLQGDARLWRYYTQLEQPKLRALIRMVARGIYVDLDFLRRQRDAAARNWQQAKTAIPVDNPSSAEQVARWLFSERPAGLGLVPLKMGKKHGSTDEPSIKRLAQAHPEVRAILPVRKWRRYIDTYFEPIEEMVSGAFDGRYHPDIRSTGTETGRLSSPFHTIPRPTPEDGAFVRSLFTAPPGYVLVEADFSQVEARLAAWRAGGSPATWEYADPEQARMLLAWGHNRDVYAEQAAQNLYGDFGQWRRITKNERQVLGKVPVLAMLYRISAEGLRDYAWREYEIDWDRKTATRIWLGFHRLWPEFKRWHEREERVLRTRGWAASLVGRLRRIPEATGFGKAASEAVGSGINMPIQSTASDLTQESMIILDAQGVPIVGNVHDALLLYVPKTADMGGVARVLERVMTREALKALEPLGLKLPPGLIQVEIKAGPWGSGKVVETARKVVA